MKRLRHVPGEQRTDLRQVFSFLLLHPASLPVLAGKIRKRLSDGKGRYTEAENVDWIRQHAVRSADLARSLAPELWLEALEFGKEARGRAQQILPDVPFDMGAGGDYEFLYWITRYRKPRVIVESGVSAGWSSLAFLSAIRANGSGTLHSSDFPYFRVANPERYIGILVPEELRAGWNLHVDGDEFALPRILGQVTSIDLFHYDSDKSISGRDFGVGQAKSKLAPDGVIFVDDILNDSWFREHVEAKGGPYTVLEGRCGVLGRVALGQEAG